MVLGASISAPDEENPFSTVERGFSSELVYFSAKFKKLRTQGTAGKKPSSKKAIFWEKWGSGKVNKEESEQQWRLSRV